MEIIDTSMKFDPKATINDVGTALQTKIKAKMIDAGIDELKDWNDGYIWKQTCNFDKGVFTVTVKKIKKIENTDDL